jgi:acetyl esterase/lipase
MTPLTRTGWFPLLVIVVLAALVLAACGGESDDTMVDGATPSAGTPRSDAASGDENTAPIEESDSNAAGETPTQAPAPVSEASHEPTPTAGPGVVFFGIGMHIEPFGAWVSQLAGGPGPRSTPASASDQGPRLDYYNNDGLFQRHVDAIATVVEIVERHGGVMTVQTQTPFTLSVVDAGSSLFADLEARGHEVGLHFHENAHLGPNSGALPADQWCAVLAEEVGVIRAAGVREVTYSSGGNLYTDLIDAMTCASLTVKSDWKNPQTQQTAPELLGTVPWRPAGSPDRDDVTAFARHDANGALIFLPEGAYDLVDFASSRHADTAGGDDIYFDFLGESLRNTLAIAEETAGVHTFNFTVHPGEFSGSDGAYGVIDRFLSDVVDPLVDAGLVQWATRSQVAVVFAEWEAENPGIDPRAVAGQLQGLTASVSSAAQNAPAPSEDDREVLPDVPYCTADGVDLLMDVYPASGGTSDAPAVIYVHGGGWTGGDKSSGVGFQFLSELTESGYVVAAVNYRLAPQFQFPAQIEDVQCAVRHLRSNAASYGIDPDRIGVLGSSAGGHLAALLGVIDATDGFGTNVSFPDASNRVQAVVDLFGPTDLTVDFPGASTFIIETVFGAVDRGDPVLRAASPVTHVSPDDPPFLIIQGTEDRLVVPDQSTVLRDRLAAAGVDAELILVRNAGHGLQPSGGSPAPPIAGLMRAVVAFFDEHLR